MYLDEMEHPNVNAHRPYPSFEPIKSTSFVSRYIEFLGSSGTRTPDKGTTCLRVSRHCVIDAGNIIGGLRNDVYEIEHIFLTHSHLDHIVDIPFVTELFVTHKKTALKIYGLKETLSDLREYIFNHHIWPDFAEIDLLKEMAKTIEFIEIVPETPYRVDDVELMAFKTDHTEGSCGYLIRHQNRAIVFTSDTYRCDRVWELVQNDPTIHSIIIDVSFPSEHTQLAKDSRHLTPALLEEERRQCSRQDITIYPVHLKVPFESTIRRELRERDIPGLSEIELVDFTLIPFDPTIQAYHKRHSSSIASQILMVGAALSSEKNIDSLLEMIITQSKLLTGADGGTLYLYQPSSEQLEFKVVQNDTLGISMGGRSGEMTWEPLDLYNRDGTQNRQMVSTICALDQAVINIANVYETKEYDFSGTINFDIEKGYRSVSMLVLPLTDHDDHLIGVLQLINKKNPYGDIIPFDGDDEEFALSLGSQAAVALTKQRLIDDLERLLEAFLHSINVAIEAKSPYTAGHIDKMVKLSLALAEAIHADQRYFPDKTYTPDELKEIKIAALMHDVGKITTPEHIIDKSTKLETIYDRIETVKLRFELLKRDAYSEFLLSERSALDQERYEAQLMEYDKEYDFLLWANLGSEYFSDESVDRVRRIASRRVMIGGEYRPLLDEDEVTNLCVRRGTLTSLERQIINNHAEVSLRMLQDLPFPKKLSRVAEIACGHHEKINGEGYPLGLKGEELSFEARLLAIADIFEALSASDRPYKQAKKISEVMAILYKMACNNEIDYDVMKFFYESGLYLTYARDVLHPENIDEVTLHFAR